MMKRSRLVLPDVGARGRAVLLGMFALAAAVPAPSSASAAPQISQAAQATQATSADDAARAHDLFKKGHAEYVKDHLPQAYAFFLEAWGIQKSFDIAGNLAFVEKQLTRYREAAEHASYALANFPAGGSDAQRKALQDALAEVRQHVGAITVRVSVARAAVTVDGRLVGESPLASDVFVDPGPHTIVATAPGCEPVQDAVTTDKGSSHLITLTPSRCGGPTPPLPPRTTPTPVVAGPNPVVIGGVVATGIGLGLGAAFAIMAKIKASDAGSQSALLGAGNPGACAVSAPSTACVTLHDTLESHDTFANAAVWTFVAASAVGVGTLVYALATPQQPPPVTAGRAQVIPMVGPGAAGLMVKGAF
jgi:PEGA domain